MTDVIELDSDDDIGIIEDPSKRAGASINILNSVPLDLNALLGGGGPIMPSRQSNGHSSMYSGVPRMVARPHHQQTPYQRPLTATVRLAANNNGVHRVILPSSALNNQRYMAQSLPAIRSSTAVTHTTSYQPLPRQPPRPPIHHSQYQPRPLMQNGIHGTPRNGVVMNGFRSGPNQSDVLKMRLQMQNGAYQRVPIPPPPPPPPPVMVVEVSAERLKNYAFDAERHGARDKNMGSPDGVMTSHRFRCTYMDCNALLYGNINFMNHIWAHVATFKPTDEDVVEDKGDTDVDMLSTCCQCLAKFEYPHQMQIHYTRAHSRLKQAVNANTCAICEKEVTSLKHHLAIHDPRDAPYKCPSCTYRSNIRLHLYDHFCRKHANHTTLLCPFCCYFKTIDVPQSKHKTRLQTLKCRDYVNHMRRHEAYDFRGIARLQQAEASDQVEVQPTAEVEEGKRRLACDKCAQCFLRADDRARHLRQHNPLADTYYCRPRGMETRNRRESGLAFLALGELSMCDECKRRKPEEREKKCAICARLCFSVDAIAGKNIAYSDDVPRSSVHALATASVDKARCACGFGSNSGNLLAAHFVNCRRQMRVCLKKKEKEEDEEDKEEDGEEKKEDVKTEKRELTAEEERQLKEEEELFAVERESTPADVETQWKKMAALQKEIEAAVIARINNRELPLPPLNNAVKRPPPKKGVAMILDPDGLENIDERLEQMKMTDDERAMMFRVRIERNDFAESERKFKEIMADRDEEED